MVVPIRPPTMAQIELFNFLLGIIIIIIIFINDLKPSVYVDVVFIE